VNDRRARGLLRSMLSMTDILPGEAPLMLGVRQTGSGPDTAGTGPDRYAARPRERNGSLPLTSTAVMRDDRSSTPAADGELNGSS